MSRTSVDKVLQCPSFIWASSSEHQMVGNSCTKFKFSAVTYLRLSNCSLIGTKVILTRIVAGIALCDCDRLPSNTLALHSSLNLSQ